MTHHLPLIREMDAEALGFWGVVSGTFTVEEFEAMRGASHGTSLFRSNVRHRLRHVLHDLATRSILSDATVDPGFDADRRCRSCGTIHGENCLGRCLRGAWGSVPLNPAGLRTR